MTLDGWREARLDEFLMPVSRLELVTSDREYRLLGVRWYGKGCHLHTTVQGAELKTGALNRVAAGDVTYNKMWVSKGAFAVVERAHDGLFATSEYPTFDTRRTMAEPAFLRWALNAPGFVERARAACRGTTSRARLNPKDFLSLSLRLPPSAEQKKIAALLCAMDNVIESTQAVIDQLQVVKKSMMAELLTRGLPGRHTRFKQTEIGEVPDGWEVTSLELLCSHIVDCPHETPDYVQTGYFAIRTADVVPGRILLTQARRVSSETYLRRIRRLEPEPGDVLYSREGERFGIAAPVPQGVKLCLGQRMMQFRASSETDPSFLSWLLNSPKVYRQAVDEVGGSTSPHVNIKSIRKFVVVRPPIMEQQQIAHALDVLSDREAAEATIVDALRAAKSALMSVLLTGDLRVTPDENPV